MPSRIANPRQWTAPVPPRMPHILPAPDPDPLRQARIDLAAAHRLAVEHGFHEGICNHFTMAVPGTSDRFFLIPYGLHWSEVAASSFMVVTYDGEIVEGEGEAERSAFCIHAPIHRLRPDAAVVLHTHMPYASALARLDDPRLQMIGQTEVKMAGLMAYDEAYTGLAEDPAEGERLAAAMAPGKTILMMAGHGVIVTGRNVAEAYDRLYYLERACKVQLYALWTGQKLRYIAPPVLERTLEQFARTKALGNKPAPCEIHFAALKRLLDRREPDYRD
jgi:ribulose-5-phosphate 4-epimerase/fuculose-1-phosphate aldolase